MQMLFSVKFYTMYKGSFFDWQSPVRTGVWRYVLLFAASCSDIAHILKNRWSYRRQKKRSVLSDKGFRLILTTKIQHEVIRVIAITDV
ncbi:hypothetical protein E2E36_09200 [Enterobacter cloacae complex sp.]|nr:hypothetical protein E2E36_09200 [Enterobacter cloacae complex sp.]